MFVKQIMCFYECEFKLFFTDVNKKKLFVQRSLLCFTYDLFDRIESIVQ